MNIFICFVFRSHSLLSLVNSHSTASRNQMNIKKTWERLSWHWSRYLRGSYSTLFEILQNKVPYENFQKLNFQRKKMGFCEIRTHDPWVMSPVFYHCAISHQESSQKKVVMWSISAFLSEFHNKVQVIHKKRIFQIFHRVPYFVGFQTKWILTLWGIKFNAVKVFPMSFWCSFDFCWPYCALLSRFA